MTSKTWLSFAYVQLPTEHVSMLALSFIVAFDNFTKLAISGSSVHIKILVHSGI